MKSFLIIVTPAQPLDTSFTTPWVEVRDARYITVQFTWTGTGSPQGTLFAEGSNDPKIDGERWNNPAAPSSAVALDMSGTFSIIGSRVLVGVADTAVATPPLGHMTYMRFRYARTSGGTGATMAIWVAGRGGSV